MNRTVAAAFVAAVVLGGCAGPADKALPAPKPAAGPPAPVVRTPMPEVGRPPTQAPAAEARPPIPEGAVYVCWRDKAVPPETTVIAFAPKVEALCRKHPEMGPCQYERDLCRKSGGRVLAAGGREITLATEAEYDRKVMRVRFRGD